jgi:hypothetical protein
MSTDIKAQLTDSMEASRQFYDAWTQRFGSWFKPRGKTMEEWRDHFIIRIPADIDVPTCKQVDVKLIALFEEAHNFKAQAEASLHLEKARYAQQYRGKYGSLVRSYENRVPKVKLPAKDTLATLTEEELGEEKDAIAYAESALQFWKEQLAYLTVTRKIIENATLNLSVEAKALNYQNMLDGMNRENNGRSHR